MRPGKPVATSERRSQATDDRHSLLRQRTTSPWPDRRTILMRARARAWFWMRSHSDKDRDYGSGISRKRLRRCNLPGTPSVRCPGQCGITRSPDTFFLHRMRWERTANLTRGCGNRYAAPKRTHSKMNRIGERDVQCRACPQLRTFKTS